MVFFPAPGALDSGGAAAASRDASRAASRAESLAGDVQFLEAKIDRMKLVTRALWEIVRDNTSITEAMLEAKVKEIDLRDGRADGRDGARAAMNCHACQRVIQRGMTKCQYCGAEQGFESVFDWVR